VDSVICGVVGAMTSEKGVHALEHIGAALQPDARARTRLLLLGGTIVGPTSFGGVLAFRAGFVDEIHPAMAGLDMLWHPSGVEGLGTAVIDAMALGVPPIAFAVGGLPELVESGVSGLLVPGGDVTAFAAAASRLILDGGLRKSLGAHGIERARLFDAERMVDGTRAVYQRVLRPARAIPGSDQ
jgi:glycosyltransferase involved in cell wall biosynthesis